MTKNNRIARFEPEADRIARQICASESITHGVTCPFQLGTVGFCPIGFADIPAVGFQGHCKDVTYLIQVGRQHIMRAIARAGLNIDAVDMKMHIRMGRTRKFVDENSASQTLGKHKMGGLHSYWLEITMLQERKEFETKLTRVYL